MIISDGNTEGINSICVGIWVVSPSTTFFIEGEGTACRRRRNREIGAIGEPIDIGGVEVTGNTAILICRGSGITGKNRWIIDGIDGQVDGLRSGITIIIGDGYSKGITAIKVKVW